MAPIVGRYGPFFLYSYFIILGLGMIVALAVTAVFARQRHTQGWLDGLLLAGLAAIVGGRVVFVILNQAYFVENPGAAWAVWRGGMNFHAALAVGLVVFTIWLWGTKRPAGAYLALIAPGLAVAVAAGWAACWFEGCAYGRVTFPSPLAAALPDEFGVVAVRYQTQAAGFVLTLLVAALATWRLAVLRPNSGPAGQLFWLTLAALGVVHALATLFRGDPSPTWRGTRLDMWVDMLWIVMAVLGFAWARWGRNRLLAGDIAHEDSAQ